MALPSAKPYLGTPPRVRALAVTSARRSSAAPEVPSLQEAGVAGYDFSSEFGLVLPARTPVEIVQRLSTELTRILKLAEIRDKLAAQGAEPVAASPEAYAAAIRSDIGKWAAVIKSAGIRAE